MMDRYLFEIKMKMIKLFALLRFRGKLAPVHSFVNITIKKMDCHFQLLYNLVFTMHEEH